MTCWWSTASNPVNVIVTGHTGFIGRHLTRALRHRGHVVNPDISSAGAVIYLAWGTLWDFQSGDHLLQVPHHLARIKEYLSHGIPNITITGTCLETVPNPPPYALAKRALLEQVSQLPGINLKWARLFYVHGPGQRRTCLLPRLRKAMLENRATFPVAAGVREFTHVTKVAGWLCRLAEQTEVTGIIDCCEGNPQTIRDFCRQQLQGQQIRLCGTRPLPKYEPKSITGDPSKLDQILCNH